MSKSFLQNTGLFRRGQAAMEYLFIVGFGLMMLLPVIALFYTQSGSIEDEVIGVQANKALDELVSAIDQVYFLGPPSKQTIRVRFPERIDAVTITDNKLAMTVQGPAGTYELVRRATANITGTIETYDGVHVLSVLATNTGVTVAEE